MVFVYVLAAILAALVLAVIVIYNGLIQKRQMVNNGWSDIDVQLKRRAELIPSLVNVVKGYAGHEKTLFEEVVSKRNEALAAQNETELRGEKEQEVTRNVSRMIALAEAYPDLKADQQFLELQKELSNTEDEISYARRFFNGAVREYNTAMTLFPANMIAGSFGFRPSAYFQADASDRTAPSVSLNG